MRMQFFILVRLLDLEESSRRKEIYFDPTLYIAADFDFAKLASPSLSLMDIGFSLTGESHCSNLIQNRCEKILGFIESKKLVLANLEGLF